jgi:hypothetical protein
MIDINNINNNIFQLQNIKYTNCIFNMNLYYGFYKKKYLQK